jgi:hypothetical protein
MAKTKDKPWVGLQHDTAENGARRSDKGALKQAKGEWRIGQTIGYAASRAGAERQVAVTLGPMRPEVHASMVGSHLLENHVPSAMADAGDAEATKSAKAEQK